ncbi:xanthine dehydrogenase family protein molybdopterin-binding subunit [Desulfosporosinus nitroreducens]|uniref:xanthine dehydrogenase family protein molybdopterin-binding subunit n=1 Tax=Desulfosporosinus nitroreducens TaxID=2018668 RepID=UPI00207CB643|nr:molybdopterin cofactor-binding domain-containing protein [Desulfosporosinus nitroreducens]MCO1602367.1 molybdopterin-dependent oxidoreductase [Desulfosporosinus nitroreducens]
MKKRGYGLANMWYGIGNTANPNPSGAFVDFLDDGTAIVLTGCADIGQGSNTVLAQIAAETLGICIEDVVIISADTEVTPDAGASSASRQTYVSGNAVRLAAEKVRDQVIAIAAEILNLPTETVNLYQGEIWNSNESSGVSIKDIIIKCRSKGILTLGHGSYNPVTTMLDPETGKGIPYATYAFATQVAEVEVDTETGIVEVKQIVAAHDVGTAINPQNVEGQIEGGCAMGIGYALLEEVILKDGEIQNPGMSTYLIPTSLDVPEIHTIIIEESEISGPYGAKGVGEPALVPTAAAIANAVADALGIRIYDLPLTPERVVAALKSAQEDSKKV